MSALPETYARLRRALRLLVRVFFKRLEVVGLENVPADRGGILVAWHPNGLVDPALILAAFPHQVVFGARHGLFQIPLLGHLVRALGTVPIYRRHDTDTGSTGERQHRNEASLDTLAERIAQGSFSALFPEGISHDAPFLKELKTGAARLYYRARTQAPPHAPPPVVIPVGLHYDQKRVFRSCALVVFHPPLELPEGLDVSPAQGEDPERVRELARGLTGHVESALKEAILETESWELHQLLHRGRKLLRAERASRAGSDLGSATMDEKVAGLARLWVGYRERAKTNPSEVKALRKRVERYDRDLRTLGVEDHELDQPPPLFRPWLWLVLLSQALSVVLVLPPFLLIGYVVNLPPAVLVAAVAHAVGKEDKDVASLKLIGGLVLFPLTWALWGWLATWEGLRAYAPWMPEQPLLAFTATVALSVAGAVVMVFYVALARATFRALRVRLTRGRRARSFARLKLFRGRLCDELLALSVGLVLPGEVLADGRVRRSGFGVAPRSPAGAPEVGISPVEEVSP